MSVVIVACSNSYVIFEIFLCAEIATIKLQNKALTIGFFLSHVMRFKYNFIKGSLRGHLQITL